MSADQIYSAKYSGVDVYEFIHPTGSIMKRKEDDWVNATHILKAAKFAKAKRTRILEKEVIKDTHEKVQGGFGKYQGTWVPLDIARSLAAKFEVLEELKPLFNFTRTPGSESPPQAPKHHHASRADSAKRRNTRTASSAQTKSSEPSSSSATPTVPRRRGRPPSNKNKKPVANLERSQSDMVFPRPAIPVSSINSTRLPSIQSPLQRTISLDPVIIRESGGSPQQFKELDIEDGLSSDIEPTGVSKIEIAQSSSPSLPTSPSGLSEDNTFDQRALNASTTNGEIGSVTSPLSAMIPRFPSQSFSQPSDISSKVNDYLSKLVDFFVSTELQSEDATPTELLYPPQNSAPYIDAWIDHEHHTAFHWACSMGNLAIVDALYNAGASTRSVNVRGENPLVRCSIFHNSFTRRSYSRIFQLLHETVFDVDSKLQTVIHHIVERKSSTPSAVCYLEVLLSKLKDFSPRYRIENLINAQDQNGDTAVHIAAQNGDKLFFQTLVQHGGLSTIKNSRGLTATEILNQSLPSTQVSIASNGKFKQIAAPSSPSDFFMYPSKTATRLSRAIPEVVNVMKEMADCYNRLHQSRETDVTNLEKTLKNMKKTVSTVRFKTIEALEADKELDPVQMMDLRFNEVQLLRRTLADCQSNMISRLERGQSRQLASLVADQEACVAKRSRRESGDDKIEQFKLALKLTQLQLKRKQNLFRILRVISDNSKIHKYRKMISQGTEMEVDEVDSCLDVILQSLCKSV
ncbi:LAQU0S01e03026g1_1 [Lachancea quebecensis]|uniref:Transcription factor MBP1 n=1 Tax=Lachancea quebecensis TaxID=1654605 RepID=A0A0P1KP20_9SACH|nr:LAQU0S01e03026g1_1 [Lachancea quebecensis]